MGSSPAGSAGTRWACSIKEGRATAVPHYGARYQVPVCQAIPGAPIDTAVAAAFFAAFAPIELDAYAQAVAAQQAHAEQLALAQRQQLERPRYEAELARRQFTRVDPDNRLVAAELEARWEAALCALKQAEVAASEAAPARALAGRGA